MKNVYHAILLGILQGLTEFLPISSSGHLVLFQHFLGLNEAQLIFDILLHVGTLGAVLVVYRRKIWRIIRYPKSEVRLIQLVFIGSIPTALIGGIFQSPLEALFTKPPLAAFMLTITGLILQIPKLNKNNTHREMSSFHAILIGTVQGLAIIPGISRSGTTISMALFLRLSPAVAAEYSFLLSLPAIGGAVLLKFKDLSELSFSLGTGMIGLTVSFVVGWLALRFLLTTLQRGKFSIFSYYCWIVGGFSLFLLL